MLLMTWLNIFTYVKSIVQLKTCVFFRLKIDAIAKLSITQRARSRFFEIHLSLHLVLRFKEVLFLQTKNWHHCVIINSSTKKNQILWYSFQFASRSDWRKFWTRTPSFFCYTRLSIENSCIRSHIKDKKYYKTSFIANNHEFFEWQ